MTDLTKLIRNIPDYPKPGVQFKDITPLLNHKEGLNQAVEEMAAPFKNSGIESVVGAEARGFIFAPAIAIALGCGFVPVRKPGKLPAKTLAKTYALEYGEDRLEIHTDAIKPKQRVLMVDDLLATGGTMKAAMELVEELGGKIIGSSFLIELAFLGGRNKLSSEIHALITYD